MIRQWLPVLLALVAVAACKKRSAAGRALAEFGEFADRICACKDKACGERVQEEMTRWTQEMAGTMKREKPTAAEIREMEDVGRKYGDCLMKLTGRDWNSAPPAEPAMTEKITNADRLVKAAFDSAGGHAVSKLVLSYVRADGTLDATYGEAYVELGKPKPPDPADDPNRPIGAPVAETAPAYDIAARCPSYRWKNGERQEGQTSCLMFGAGLARPKCSVLEVWRRAIEKGAPPKGLAVLRLDGPRMQSWTFAIDDAPRDIHFSLDVEDTCDPTLEKPQ